VHVKTGSRINRTRYTQRAMQTIALTFQCSLLCVYAICQSSSKTIRLAPKESETIPISLEKGQVARFLLRLEGGIIAVASTSPSGANRPLWPIDLGRGAALPYVVGGEEAGQYHMTIRSYERERIAQLTVTIEDTEPLGPAALQLQEAEDDLANAELARRRWAGAPANLNAAAAFRTAFNLARELGDVPLQRLALTQEARLMLFSKGEFEGASSLLEQATAIAPADNPSTQALAWKTLSTARYDLGQFAGAIQAGNMALDLYRQTGDKYWQGVVLGNLSSVYSELGQLRDAISMGNEALVDAKLEHDPAGVVYCLSQLAGLYGLQGDLQAAFRTYHEGLSWVSQISYAPLVEAEIQKDLGVFSVQVNDWQEASRALRRALAIEGDRDDPVTLESRGALAQVLEKENHLGRAVEADGKAIAIAGKLNLKQNQADLLLKRASIHLKRHCIACADADIHQASALASELQSLPLQIEVEQAAGETALATDPLAAQQHFGAALRLSQQIGEREEQSKALVGAAYANQAQNQLEEALWADEKALQILEASRSRLSSIELQANYFAIHRSWYELAVELCMQLDHIHPGKGYAARAFAYTERARARSLLDALQLSSYDPAREIPERLREAFARNRQQIENEKRGFIGSADEARRNAIAARLQTLYHDREALESQMDLAEDRLQSIARADPIDVPAIQKNLLDANSALLSYWVGTHASYRWTISAKSMSVRTIPSRATLERVLEPLSRALSQRRPTVHPGEDISAYEKREQILSYAVQDNLAHAGALLLSDLPVRIHTLLVVADDALISVPFPALRIQTPEGPQYAIEHFAFLHEPSASVAVHLRQNWRGSHGNSVAVFADPVLSTDDSRMASPATSALPGTGPEAHLGIARLTGSMREAHEILHIVSHVPVELYTGFDSTPEQVRRLDPARFSILHFATHTVAVAGNPEISGITLSVYDRFGRRDDGVLWARDVYAMRFPIPLIMLSGCTTENQESSTSEGLNSLAHAFFFSGVRAIGASLWSIDDNVATRLMSSFYRRLAAGTTVTESLRGAQLEVLHSRSTSSPSLWGSFILEGWPELALSNQERERHDSAFGKPVSQR